MATPRTPGTPPRQQAKRPPARATPGKPIAADNSARTAPAALVAVRRIFAAETGNYFLLLGTTLFLVVFGLVMVLSSSAVDSFSRGDNFFTIFIRQGMFALIGIPLMLVASRMPVTFWKRWARPAIVLGIGLQLLVFVPGLGYGYGGNQNWIMIGGFSAQPSEFVKLALIVFIASVVVSKQHLFDNWKELTPIILMSAMSIGLVLVGKDLGTAIIMISIVLGMLFFSGVRLKFLAVAVGFIAVAGVLFAFASSSRTDRIGVWISGCTEADYQGVCWQIQHGMWALAAGGFFGVGLGNSKAKWNWLPEAESDFIFAIIGEELGLLGAIVVLLLFVVLAIAFIRIIRSSTDTFGRVATSGVMIWVIGQAFVNIAVVLGLLPVLGVPLPLISAGGSALIANLLAIGVVLSFARHSSTPDGELVAQTPAERSRLAAGQRTRTVR